MPERSQSRIERMIVRARVVVPIGSPPIENGAVAISGNRITAVGKFPEIKAAPSPHSPADRDLAIAAQEIVDLGEQVLLPGLINSHCHLDYTCLRGKIPQQKSFTDWIRVINAEKGKLSPSDYASSIREGFAEAKRFGTTAMANLTGFSELMANIDDPIRTWWFPELIDVRDPNRADNIVNAAVQSLRSKKGRGLAPHAPFTASASLYQRCNAVAQSQNVLLTTHLAESRDEMTMFRDAAGPLYEFLRGIGRDMRDCGKRTPVANFFEVPSKSGSLNHPYLLVHLNEVTDDDLKVLARFEFSAIHCPRSHDYFGHSPFQFEKLQQTAANICLGTDSLASNDDLSLFAEMRQFQKSFPNTSSKEILAMATMNAARALQQEDRLGRIAAGFLADLIAFPCANPANVLDEIVAHDRPIEWLMLNGTVQRS